MNINQPPPLTTDLVLIGGGHAHVYLLKMFGMPKYKSILTKHGIQVTLITKDVMTPYSGMLPGYLAGYYTYDEIHLDLRKLCQFGGVRLIHTSCTGISYKDDDDDNGKYIECSDGRPNIRYDVVSVDIGCTPSSSGLEGAKAVTAVKPISSFADRFQSILDRISDEDKQVAEGDSYVFIVVGGGAGGIEVCLSFDKRLKEIFAKKNRNAAFRLVLMTRGSSILTGHNAMVQKKFQRILKERGVEVILNANVVGVNDEKGVENELIYEIQNNAQPQKIKFDDCLWCTSANAASWIKKNTPFRTDCSGFLLVNDYLECVDHRGAFAAGDCASMTNYARPKGK